MTDRKPLETEPYKGVRDFYPEQWAELLALFEKQRKILRSWGYEEYQASPLEHSELYESKGNEEIIRDQTFSFEDRGGRRVTLRPEMTPTLARMVARKRRELAYPLRWFSTGNRFRYERTQRGRLREFFQTDVDLIGLPEGEADFEIIEIAYEMLKAFGAGEKDFRIRVNSRKLLRASSEAAGHSAETSREYLRLLDRKEKIEANEYQTELKKLGEKDPMDIIEAASGDDIAAERDRTKAFVKELQARGIGNAVFDPTLTRGFDYYTGVVFEIFDTDPANPRSLFGGGRYDGLVSMFGEESVPAIGFAVGDVVLMDFLETHGLALRTGYVSDVYVGTPSAESIPAAHTFVRALRKADIRVSLNITERAMGDQIKRADKKGIPFFIAYGPDEAKSKKVRVKELASGIEKKMDEKKVADYIKKCVDKTDKK